MLEGWDLVGSPFQAAIMESKQEKSLAAKFEDELWNFAQ